MGGWPSTTGNPSGGGRWNKEEEDDCDDHDEINEEEDDMSSPFVQIEGNLVKKSTIIKVVPSYLETETTLKENNSSDYSYRHIKEVRQVKYQFFADIETASGEMYQLKLPDIPGHENCAYSYDYRATQEVITQENADFLLRVCQFGSVLRFEPEAYTTEFVEQYAISVVHRYMNDMFTKKSGY
jgi:hypothetical protein